MKSKAEQGKVLGLAVQPNIALKWDGRYRSRPLSRSQAPAWECIPSSSACHDHQAELGR